MVTAIVFSKDRPLQLEAWLESLFHHVGIEPEAVIALVREEGAIRYDALRGRWPTVRWILETDFARDLSEAVRKADPFILWGCDDVVFKGPVDLSLALHRLAREPQAAAFSLRLGRSIEPCPADLEEREGVLEWNWRRAREPHWNYPWEVSGSIYRKHDVERLLAGSAPARSPNFLEADIATRMESDPSLLPPRLLSFSETKCLTVTVNRVQETHPNPFDASSTTDVETLWELHRQGQKMDWHRLEGRTNDVIHVDASWFALKAPSFPARVEVAPTGPLTSILCFVYNRERYVEETIRSALGQKGAPIELVLLDDGSTDRTPERLLPFLDDPRVRHVRQENVGHDGSFHKLNNRCVELARGEFLSFVGADDIFDPHKTARQLEAFHQDPSLDVVFSDGRHIDGDGRHISSDFRRPESMELTPLNLLRNLFRSNFIAHPTVMMRRDSYLRGGWFENGFAADYHFWLKTALTHRYRYLDEKLLSYRVHAEGSSTGIDNPSHREALKVRGIARAMFGPDDFYPELLVAPDRKSALAEAFLDLGNRSLAVYSDLELAAADYERSLSRADSAIARHNLGLVLLAAGRSEEGRRLLESTANGPGAVAESARIVLSGRGKAKILGLAPDGFLARAIPMLEQRARQGLPTPLAAIPPAAFAGGVPCAPRGTAPSVPRLESLLVRAEALVAHEDFDAAAILLREASALPGADDSLRGMADTLDQAASARRRATSRESSALALAEADRLFAAGDPDGAFRTLDNLGSDEETLEIVNAKAWLLQQAGKSSQAHLEYVKAAQLWPENPEVHSNLAGIRLRMGRHEQAESSLRRVLTLRPDDPEALLALARLRVVQGDPEEAHRLYNAFQRVATGHQAISEAREAITRLKKESIDTPASPSTTIVIPVKDQLPLLAKCLDSLDSTCGHLSLEILVVDDHSNEDTSRALSAWERAGRIRLLKAPVAGNFAASCNAGAAVAKGRTLVFLNSDIEAKPGWLEALLKVVDETGVGAVGARLLYPDGCVQHAGIAFGPDGIPYHPNRGQDGESALVIDRKDMPGLTGACLAIRAQVFSDLGGFDEAYRFQVEDLDLCLRVWTKGLRVVYEPAACLIHHEGASSAVRPEKDRLFREGLSRLFSTWADKGGFPRLVQALPGFPAMLKPSVPFPTGQDASTPATSASSTSNFDTSSSASPKVSVVLPTRDRPVFLRRALESLRKQTIRDFEVVVVNDAGSDVSAIVAAFANDDFPIRLEVHPERRGLGAARNTGIRSARAPWIAYLDDDDLYYPDHLRLLLETLERTGAKVAYSDSMRAVEEERNGEWIVLSNELAMSNDFDRDAFLRTNLTPVNNVVHARTCWEQVGCIDESLPVLEDWDFWIRLSRRWDFVHVPVATTEIRWRSNGANMTFQRQREFQPTRDRIAQKVAQMFRMEQLEREGVSIVILVRDCLEVTRECIESLERHTPEVHEILMIDNGSGTETAAWLRDWVSTRPHAVLVRNDDNRGFAGGNNQGLALAKGRFLLLLNNDTVLTPGWLGRMLAVFDRHPECGAVGPVSNCISGPQIDTTAVYADTDGLLRHAGDRSQRFADRSEEILRAVGFCLLFRRDVFGAVGGLDERFGKGNFEDDDFSLRVRHAGWTSRMALDAFVHHVGGATFKGENIDYTKSLLTNWAIFLHKWGLPDDLPYEKGYPLQQSPPKLALSRIETPTPLQDHVLVEGRVYLPSDKAVVPAATDASKPAAGKLTISSLDKLAKSITMESVNPRPSNDPASKPRTPDDELEEMSRMLLLAEASAARGGLADADRITEEVVGKFPHQNMAWLARAMVLRGLGKFKKAAEAIAKAIQERETPEALLEAMQIHLLADEAAPARKAEKALKERHAAWFKATREEFRASGKPWPPDFTKSAKAAKTHPSSQRVKKW